MTLGQKQRKFSHMIAELIIHAYKCGYEVTVGDFYRDPRVHGAYGVKGSYSLSTSQHKKRLAGDLNLFKDGVYLTKTSDHEPLGRYWEDVLGGYWGGNFNDGNHYQYEES